MEGTKRIETHKLCRAAQYFTCTQNIFVRFICYSLMAVTELLTCRSRSMVLKGLENSKE